MFDDSEAGRSRGRRPNRYNQVIERVFFLHHSEGATEVEFERQEFESIAGELGIRLPKNLGDIVYSFRYRASLPESIQQAAPAGKVWIIRGIGRGRYRFAAVLPVSFTPREGLAETKVLDATPGVIEKYSTGDEQALLAKLRYNRLIDIFTGVTCYSLQNHLRTTLPSGYQVETDEVYIGVDQRGAHYIIPVQAKAEGETLGVVQIEQDLALCTADRFKGMICRPIGAQFMEASLICLFEFVETVDGPRIAAERHYRLVPPDELTPEELQTYQKMPFDRS